MSNKESLILQKLKTLKRNARMVNENKKEDSLKRICGKYIYNSKIELTNENSTEDVRDYIEKIGKCVINECKNITDEKLCSYHKKNSIINLLI